VGEGRLVGRLTRGTTGGRTSREAIVPRHNRPEGPRVAANKRFDMLVFPGERHGYVSPAASRYSNQRIVEYLVENL